MRRRRLLAGLAGLAAAPWAAGPASATGDVLRWAVTTTFRNSGLAARLLPAAEAALGIDIQVLVVGSGQAVGLARRGDVDAVMIHSRRLEAALVAEGIAPHRREIMYNDFVLVGPGDDPVGLGAITGAVAGFAAIARARATFVSRGDDSGTHQRELELWRMAGLDPAGFPVAWYKSVGAGMGTALNIASGLEAHVLSDRASWLTFLNKGRLAILLEGDPVLFNQYTYLPVSRRAHPHVRADLARRLEGWLTSQAARALIDGYRLNGQRLFTFNATPEGAASGGGGA